jgi:hypothetical protein
LLKVPENQELIQELLLEWFGRRRGLAAQTTQLSVVVVLGLGWWWGLIAAYRALRLLVLEQGAWR